MSKYSVILPTYNERENLPLMISMLNKHFGEGGFDWEVVVVEDSSPDGTLAVAQELQQLYGKARITIVSRPGKMGLGSAYMDGLKHCKGDFVFLMDADMSHHPRHLASFISKQKEQDCDIVTGTRYSLGGGVAGWDLRRVLTSRGANLLANLLLTPGVSDLTGSFRLYKRTVLERLIKAVKGKTCEWLLPLPLLWAFIGGLIGCRLLLSLTHPTLRLPSPPSPPLPPSQTCSKWRSLSAPSRAAAP